MDEFQEYPKAIYLDGDLTKEAMVVQSKEQEDEAINIGFYAFDAPKPKKK